MKQVKNKIYVAVCILLGFLTACIDDEDVDVNIVANAKMPVLSDVSIVAKTASTVTLEGEVVSAQGYPVTERGIVWGTSSSLEIERDAHKSLADGNHTIQLTAEDLKGSTTYYFRLYAKNRAGTAYSKDTLTTTNSGLGSVKTFINDKNTRATTAVAGGYIEDPGEGEIIEYGVYYSDVESMSPKDSIIGAKIERDSFVCELSNLETSTKYYIRAYVINSFGLFMGDTMHLTTGSGMPVLSDDVTVQAEWTKATVTGEVISVGDAPIISRGFCWNTTGNPQVSDNRILVAISGDGTGTMSTDIQPLLANQQYYVSAFAENDYGFAYSPPKPFTTKSDLPTVITFAANVLNDGEVSVEGIVSYIGISDVDKVGVCYSATKPIPDTFDSKVEIVLSTPVSATDVPYNFSAIITGLKGGTTYNICAYAINGSGTSYGTPIPLQTPPIFTLESESFAGGDRVEGSSAYFVVGDKGYLLGGNTGPTFINNLWSYNPISNYGKWGEYNAYPAGNMGWSAAAVIDTRVFVLGGIGTGSEERDDFYVYNSEYNIWNARPTGPDSAYSRVGSALNNEVIYVGGIKDTAKNEVWAFNVNTNIWSQKADFPVNQHGGIAVTINNNVYAGLGKNTSGDNNKQLWKSNGALTSWTLESTATSLTGNILAYAVLNNKLYIIDKTLTYRYYLFEYDPTTQVWRRMSELPNYGSWNIQFMYAIRNRIYIGFVDNNKVVMYNPYWDN